MPNRTFLTRFLGLLILCLGAAMAHGQDETPFTRLFDTGDSAHQPLSPDALIKRPGWTLVSEDITNHQFTGDAVFMNDKLAVVLSQSHPEAAVYSKTASGFKHRASISHYMAAAPLSSAVAFKIIENSSGSVMLETVWPGQVQAALRFRLTTGEAILEVRPNAAAESVAVQSQSRYLVVPDYFADDLILETSAATGHYIPAENFCLNLLAEGEAMLMTVWQSSEQDAWLAKANPEKAGALSSHRIRCFKEKSIWLAFLETQGIWRAGNIPKDWKPPFPAKWRCSFARDNGLADSWDLDRGASPSQQAGSHPGPLIVYPIDRSEATPLTATCPTDVMRNTLGVGPCQYILAVEGLAAEGEPTPNNVMNWVESQFEKHKEKKMSDDIKARLDPMITHVRDARARIERYAEFAVQVRRLLTDAANGGRFASLVNDLEQYTASGLAPANSPAQATKLTAEVLGLIGKENSLVLCQRLGGQLRDIGAVQDGTMARCRMAVRRLRQLSRTLAVNQPVETTLAAAIQNQSEQMLNRK